MMHYNAGDVRKTLHYNLGDEEETAIRCYNVIPV